MYKIDVGIKEKYLSFSELRHYSLYRCLNIQDALYYRINHENVLCFRDDKIEIIPKNYNICDDKVFYAATKAEILITTD